MNTLALQIHNAKQKHQHNLPVTPRGRALHTVAWFLNGNKTQNNFDHPNLSVDRLSVKSFFTLVR